jgi:hypothetical protein
VRIFLDNCVLNDALRDSTVLARLRFLRQDHHLLTSTTVAGEALAVLGEGEKEGQYMLVDLMRDLGLEMLQPRKGWREEMAILEEIMLSSGVALPSSELAHMSLATIWSVDLYITSRPEARTLSKVEGLSELLKVVDLDQAKELVMRAEDNH